MPKLLASVAARSSILLTAALAIAACSGATPSPSGSPPPGSSGPSQSGSPGPSGDPTGDVIDHPTGATDVILRLEEGGGFVPMEFAASQAPVFTLYGNGVVVFQQAIQSFPAPDANGVTRGAPWRTAKLDETQIQELLAFALGPGGLAIARAEYRNDMVADAATSTFTVRAGGLDKTVAVYALFEEAQPGPDGPARKAFFQLAQRLRDFDRGGSIPSDVFQPERYRGILIESGGGIVGKPVAWPWPALKPADFVAGPGDGTGGSAFPHRTMSAEEVAALGLGAVPGGAQGVFLAGPDGKTYSFILRPLLADEKQ